ncbi:hypothetical protein AV530_001017 [Patagioenas fasciata monilis]|uniref:Uncharacterized protein n=1 Tax=Patagioenas fasciata monilis TaxID=372326 RepID=A0A1V4KT21_PATFA|nr:hypothetical protein AV530_001017 [Patagioenas fasciata monilis]
MHTPIHSDHEAKRWRLQEKRVIDSRSLEELNVVMLKDTDTSNVPGRWQRFQLTNLIVIHLSAISLAGDIKHMSKPTLEAQQAVAKGKSNKTSSCV